MGVSTAACMTVSTSMRIRLGAYALLLGLFSITLHATVSDPKN
jgi:hypothetical protein